MTARDGVFIYGYYGMQNFGDDLLVRAVIQGLQPLLPGAIYYLRNFGSIGSITDLDAKVVLTDVERIAQDTSRPKLVRLVRYLAACWRWLHRTRWLVLGGGTVIHGREARVANLLLLLICVIARLAGNRIAGVGLGISVLNDRLSRMILRAIVALSNAFYVRDEPALRQCRAAGCEGGVRLTADLVYGLLPAGTGRREAPRRRCVGVSLVDTAAVFWPEAPGLRDRVLAAVADRLRRMQAEGWDVLLLAFQTVTLPDGTVLSDRTILSDLREQIGNAGVEMTDVIPTEEGIGAVYGRLDLLIGMRFHGLMLAAMFGRPFIGFAYENKVDALCEQFGMPAAPLEAVTAGWLERAVAEASGRVPDGAVVRELARRAALNFEIFRNAPPAGDAG